MVVPIRRAVPRTDLEHRLERLDSPAVADAQRGLNVLHPRIKSLVPGRAVAGPAFTAHAYPGSMMTLQKAMLEARPGDILVVDGEADVAAGALWGDIMAVEAKRRGFKAIVVDGAVRDLRGLLDVGFPTFAVGLTPRLGTNLQIGRVQVPVSCGGVAVRPGDWIFGDDDGVVMLPAEQLEAIVEAAEAIERRDREMARRVAEGESLADLLGFHRFIDAAEESVSVMTRPGDGAEAPRAAVGSPADG
jgi:4-hydroxy-4-methyl-2-oxoglutarate aldolase